MVKNEPIVKVIESPSELEGLEWSKTSKWMFNRLQLGRKDADNLIAEEKIRIIKNLSQEQQRILETQPITTEAKIIFKEINEKAVNNIFEVAIQKDLRTLQYIIRDDTILGVATEKHNIISTKTIAKTVSVALQNNNYDIRDQFKRYSGAVATNRTIKTPFGDFKVGLSIGYGNFRLTRAIRMGIYFEVEVCTNPLTFLELKATQGMHINLAQHRFLRIGQSDNILKKVELGVAETTQLFNSSKLPARMIKNGKAYLSLGDANALVKAMGTAYRIGEKIQEEVITAYKNSLKKVWQLTMIMSKIAADEGNFRKDAVKTAPKLSTMSLVLLTSTELRKMVKNSYNYCETHNISL